MTMDDQRLRPSEIDLLRDRLHKGYHLDKQFLIKVAAEYLRLYDLVVAIDLQIKNSNRAASGRVDRVSDGSV